MGVDLVFQLPCFTIDVVSAKTKHLTINIYHIVAGARTFLQFFIVEMTFKNKIFRAFFCTDCIPSVVRKSKILNKP